MQFRSRRHLIVWLLRKLSHTLSVWVWPDFGTNTGEKKGSWFFLLRIHVTRIFFTDPFLISYTISFSLTPPPYVMSSHLSLSTGGKPEPLACCQLDRGWGYILLADAKWTGPLPHNAHYWKTFGNGRWHGGGQKRDRVLVRTRPLCHLTWHIKTAALHQCSSGLIHS